MTFAPVAPSIATPVPPSVALLTGSLSSQPRPDLDGASEVNRVWSCHAARDLGCPWGCEGGGGSADASDGFSSNNTCQAVPRAVSYRGDPIWAFPLKSHHRGTGEQTASAAGRLGGADTAKALSPPGSPAFCLGRYYS